jgi:uncharacterized SAM-dependent methyltransferase
MMSAEPSKDLFISYSHNNGAIVDAFVNDCLYPIVGHTKVFYTGQPSTSIKPGEDWRKGIGVAIASAKVVLLMVSPDYANSDICKAELGAAWAMKDNVLPVIILDQWENQVDRLMETKQCISLENQTAIALIYNHLKSIPGATEMNETVLAQMQGNWNKKIKEYKDNNQYRDLTEEQAERDVETYYDGIFCMKFDPSIDAARQELLKHFSETRNEPMNSLHSYIGKESSRSYAELLHSDAYRQLAENTLTLLKENVMNLISFAKSNSVRIVSLGIGPTAENDIEILKAFLRDDKRVEYWAIDASKDVIVSGIEKIQESIVNKLQKKLTICLCEMDFLRIKHDGVIRRLHDDATPTLFLLLGNTLGNYDEDALLKAINQAMFPGDCVLIDNQLITDDYDFAEVKRDLLEIYSSDFKKWIKDGLDRIGVKSNDGEIKVQVSYEKLSVADDEKDCISVNANFKPSQEILRNKKGWKKDFSNKEVTIVMSRKYKKGLLENNIINPKSRDWEKVFGSYYPCEKNAEIALLMYRKK